MAMGECKAFSSLQRTQRSSLQLGYKLVSTWHWLSFTQMTRMNSCIWLHAIDDSAINIVIYYNNNNYYYW